MITFVEMAVESLALSLSFSLSFASAEKHNLSQHLSILSTSLLIVVK